MGAGALDAVAGEEAIALLFAGANGFVEEGAATAASVGAEATVAGWIVGADVTFAGATASAADDE